MLVAILFAAAVAGPTAEDLSWMSGYWLSCENGRETSETWSRPQAGVMLGYGSTLEGGRRSFEWLRLETSASGVAYVAQPGGVPPAAFQATEVGPDRARFEAPDHGFPQRIIYARAGDALTARIEGDVEGRPQAFEWRFRSAELNASCPS